MARAAALSGFPVVAFNTRSRASRRSSAAVRSSITLKWGAIPASRGKRPNRDSQNEWMVRILGPSVVSATSANMRRTRARSAWSSGTPVCWR